MVEEIVMTMDPVRDRSTLVVGGLLGIGTGSWPVITGGVLNTLASLLLLGHTSQRALKASGSRPLGS